MNAFRPTLIVAFVCAAFALPLFVSAQASDEAALSSTIRAAILSDPRSQSMTEAEVDAMVVALTRQAQSVGMTADDIVWRPAETGTVGDGAAGECGFLCALNHAFGFDGSDYTIPIWLGACSLMLIFLIAAIWEYQHLHKRRAASQPPQVQ